ncbi:MAG: putative quinol monooxygenase [Stellaceae bacterium]
MLAFMPAILTGPAMAQTTPTPTPRQYVVVYVEFLPVAALRGGLKLAQLAALARKSTGLVSFDVDEQIARPNFYSLVEIWSNATDYQNFLNADRTKALLATMQPLFEAPLDERPGNLVK